LSADEEAIIVAFGRHTLLPLDDCLHALQATIPNLTRSSLHRCLQRHGISRLPDVTGDKPAKKKFKSYPIGYFHIDEVQTGEGKLYLYVAIDLTSKFFGIRETDEFKFFYLLFPPVIAFAVRDGFRGAPFASWLRWPPGSQPQPSWRPLSRLCPTRSIRF
jgi:hypothetical protein